MASRFSLPLRNSHCQALPGRHLAAGGGLPTHCKRSNKNSNSRPTILALIHSYHTSVSLFHCPPIPRRTVFPALQSAGGVRCPTTALEQLPPHISPASILSGTVLTGTWIGTYHRVFSAPLWTWWFCPLNRAARRRRIPYDEYLPSPPNGSRLSNDSPFSFHPPAVSRKRTLGSHSSDTRTTEYVSL